MPDGGPYLDQDVIELIALWIDEGALPPDNSDDGGEDGCADGEIVDCDGICFSDSYLEDGVCNDGTDGGPNFNCVSLFF